MNYDPSSPRGLPRSQDACFLKETTGLYLITRDALLKTGCRIGLFPLPKIIDPEYALDIDTMNDFHEAEKLLSNQNL